MHPASCMYCGRYGSHQTRDRAGSRLLGSNISPGTAGAVCAAGHTRSVRGIDVTDAMARSVAEDGDGYMGAAGSFAAGDQGYRDALRRGLRALMVSTTTSWSPNAGEVGFPDLAP